MIELSVNLLEKNDISPHQSVTHFISLFFFLLLLLILLLILLLLLLLFLILLHLHNNYKKSQFYKYFSL